MKAMTLLAATLSVSALSLLGETIGGDITAAVRASGATPTISSIPASGRTPGSCTTAGLFDGHVSIGDADYLSSGQRFFFEKSVSSSFTLFYAVPDAFCPGEDIVVTAVVFAVGRSKKDGSAGSYFTDYDKRMPLAWTLEGSNDGDTWAGIASVTNQGGYVLGKYGSLDDVYSGACDIANETSYRRYRITVTENTGDATFMIQLTEVSLLGFYGGTYAASRQKADVTAAARGSAQSRSEQDLVAFTVTAPNLAPHAATMPVEKAFDGTVSDGGTDRFLATAASTSSALAGEGAIVECDFADTFRNGGDVVVTGYTLDTQTGQGGGNVALQRMPKSWVFEAYDHEAQRWVALDSYDGFVEWETRDVDGYSQYVADFSFPNTASYRKYRFRITELNGGTQVQFSEIRLHGYARRGIAGEVGADDGEGHAIDITAWGRQYFTPVVSNSDCATILAGTYTSNLFDGILKNNWVLYTLGEEYFPFSVYYEIPETCLPGVEFVVTNYTLSARYGGVSNYEERRPYSWRLEGWCEEQSRWVPIDRRSGFTEWLDDAENLCHYADFALVGNAYAFRRYRLAVRSVRAKSSTRQWQLALSEIVLRGAWGKGISVPVVQSAGMMLLFR